MANVITSSGKPMKIIPIDHDHQEFLHDESRLTGSASSISFPRTTEDVLEIVGRMHQSVTPLTIQGARTGITGGAVPQGGHVLNLSKMNRIQGLRYDKATDSFFLRAQPGVILSDLNSALARNDFDTNGWSAESLQALKRLKNHPKAFFFTPDPTESTASVGGMIACNASGARSFRYGPTRNHISGLEIVLSEGNLLWLSRGELFADGKEFTLSTPSGLSLSGLLPSYNWPVTKNAAGYQSTENMDLLDLFIGMEGTLGVITSAELRLIPLPESIQGLFCFLPSEKSAVDFVRSLRGECADLPSISQLHTSGALEFFDHHSLELLRTQKKTNPAFGDLPELPQDVGCAVYVEYHGTTGDVETSMEQTAEVLSSFGADEDATWVAESTRELNRLKEFRHALPESVNLIIAQHKKKDPTITKLGTDLAVPDEALDEMMRMYRRDLDASGLDSVMFGHIGSNHVHVNILPSTQEQYQLGKQLYYQWAERIVSMGGTVSAEHGIGKLKRELLQLMFGESGIREMRRLKRIFDPEELLNPGNLFGASTPRQKVVES